MALVHYSLLEGVAFEESVFQVLSWSWMYWCCWVWDTVAGLLFLSFLFSFWLYASVLPLGCCVVAETRCNWYLLILIYSLYRKILWTDQYNQPSLPNYSKQRLMVPQIVPQFLWKKHARKPSGQEPSLDQSGKVQN